MCKRNGKGPIHLVEPQLDKCIAVVKDESTHIHAQRAMRSQLGSLKYIRCLFSFL